MATESHPYVVYVPDREVDGTSRMWVERWDKPIIAPLVSGAPNHSKSGNHVLRLDRHLPMTQPPCVCVYVSGMRERVCEDGWRKDIIIVTLYHCMLFLVTFHVLEFCYCLLLYYRYV